MNGVDYIMNGQGFGSVAQRLLRSRMDPGVMRPWISKKDGRSYITCNDGYDDNGEPKFKNFLTNAPALLTRDAWIHFDEQVQRVARPQLRLWGDLVSAGLTYDIPNGMATTVLQSPTMTDFGQATLSMDGLRKADRDRGTQDFVNLPLPIAHGDFKWSLREVAPTLNSFLPLDKTSVEQTTRKISELIEKLTLGTLDSYSYGGGTIYGLTNFPSRQTKTLTLPTAGGWTPQKLVDEILDMIQLAQDRFFNGPYGLYFSTAWTKYLDNSFSATYSGETLRTRLMKTDNLRFLRKLDYLNSGYQVLLVQLSQEVVRAVSGMELQTIQWEGEGGMELNWKIMCIKVPQVRTDASGNCGIVHGTAA